MNDWDYLPNAVHIDRVLASLKANPDKWEATWEAVRNAARSAAWNAELDAERKGVWIAARDAALDAALRLRMAALYPACNAVWGAILALIAYDDCAYMLDSDPGELAILAKFGDPRAILLLPACKVFNMLAHQSKDLK